MKKSIRTAKTAQPTRILVLAESELRSAIGGTEGTIISQNIVARLQEVAGR